MMTRIPTIGMTGRILLATTAFLRFHTSSRSKVKITIKLSRPPPHSRVVQTLTVTVPGSLKKQMLVKMRSSSSCLLWRLVAGRSRHHCSSCSLAAAPPARHTATSGECAPSRCLHGGGGECEVWRYCDTGKLPGLQCRHCLLESQTKAGARWVCSCALLGSLDNVLLAGRAALATLATGGSTQHAV